MHSIRSIRVKNQELTLTAKILLYFFAFADFIPRPFESKFHYTKKVFNRKANTYNYYKILKRLSDRGWLKTQKEGRKILYSLTEKGKLEALFIKAQLSARGSWDGKWRMIIFDIPEVARRERNRLRSLLKINGYKQIQKSVFMNPYPLNREAIQYLQETGLSKYIRLFRIDAVDDEIALKKMFSL